MGFLPMDLAASTYSFFCSDSDSPRVIRKNSTQPINESAKIKFKKPGPKNDISPIAKIRKGKDNNKSAIRESTVSNQPLKYPAIKPKDVPTRTEIVVAIIPTAMETRVPSMIRENKS